MSLLHQYEPPWTGVNEVLAVEGHWKVTNHAHQDRNHTWIVPCNWSFLRLQGGPRILAAGVMGSLLLIALFYAAQRFLTPGISLSGMKSKQIRTFPTHAIMNYRIEPEGRNMTQPQVLEGQWEEILARNDAQLAGRKVKITIEPDEAVSTVPAFPPNEQALAMLYDLVKLQEGMRETDGSLTDRLLREARAGGMYGLKPTE
jgi:hypothetical protein